MDSEFEYEFSSDEEEVEEKLTLASNAVKIEVKISVKEEDDSTVCKICQKKFTSKKAVGGHMRVHTEFQYSTRVPPKKQQCPLCDKVFMTEKSLHGHMRCHPDRKYRGMIPPTNSIINVETTLDDHEPDDQVSSSESSREVYLGILKKGWTTKRRGSCSSSGGSNVVENSGNNDQKLELFNGAVHGLMFLATGDDCYRACKRRVCENTDNDDLKMYKGQIDRKSKSVIDSEDKSKMVVISETDNYMKAGDSGKKKKKNIAVIRDSESGKIYSCNICNKPFTTPQALGGHTSSAHNKMQKLTLGVVDIVDDGGLDARYDNVSVPVIGSSSISGGHICKQCGKAFMSGQALGGHMRLHWPSDIASAVVPAVDPQGKAFVPAKEPQGDAVVPAKEPQGEAVVPAKEPQGEPVVPVVEPQGASMHVE